MKHKRNRVAITFENEEKMAKESFAHECEINNIMAKYQKTGLIDHVREGGQYIDLPDSMDYQTALNKCLEAEASFDALPSTIRAEFANDPAKFLAFVEDPQNVEKMGQLGLLPTPQNTLPDQPRETENSTENSSEEQS